MRCASSKKANHPSTLLDAALKASHHRREVSISPEEARLLSLGVPADISTSCSSRQISQDGEEVKDEFIPAWVFQYPPPSYLPSSLVHLPHPQLHQQTCHHHQQLPRTPVMEQEGHLT